MAKGTKTGGRDFLPGKPGGPGKPPLTPEQRELRKLTKTQVEEVYNRFLQLSVQELEQILKDKTQTTLSYAVARMIADGLTKSDRSMFHLLIDRLIGKIKEEVAHTYPKPVVIEHFDGSQLILGTKNEDISE